MSALTVFSPQVSADSADSLLAAPDSLAALLNTLDSQYGILEAERQPLTALLARTALAETRERRWLEHWGTAGDLDLARAEQRYRALHRLRLSAEAALARSSTDLVTIETLVIAAISAAPEPAVAPALTRRNPESFAADTRSIPSAPASGSFLMLKGLLPWPAQGSVSRSFGTRRNMVFNTETENPGIDLVNKSAQPVHAVADGVVATISWLRGYGTVCIVQHSGDHHTVYARLSDVRVVEGQAVRPGDLLGRSEFDSVRSEYTMHFEVWSGKEKQDPLGWLAPAKN
ncbi:MAG: M23 family metallopeptidase [bacterium]|nr:M23 family metallopeptidase [bacterium]